MLDAIVHPVKTQEGKVALDMVVINTDDEEAIISGARPAFNPKITDGDGGNYTPSVGYTADVQYLHIPPNGAYATRVSYRTVEEVREQWDGLLDDDDEFTIVHDPRNADEASGKYEVHPGINPEWSRALTVEFSIQHDGSEYVDTVTFTPKNLETSSFEDSIAEFPVSDEAGFRPY